MYISNTGAYFNNEGHFIFKNIPHLANSPKNVKFYEISTFDKGFDITIHYKSITKKSNHTYNINLINKSHDNNKNLLIHQLIESIPKIIKEIAGNFLYAQSSLLQLCAQYKAAINLLITNPNLLWIIAGKYYKQEIKTSEIAILLSKKQKYILQSLFPKKNISPACLNFLSKVHLYQGNLEEFIIIENALNNLDLTTILTLNHWEIIPVIALESVNQCPLLAVSKLYQKEICSISPTMTSSQVIHIRNDIFSLFRDTVDLGSSIEINNLSKIMKRITNKPALVRLHDKWLEKSYHNRFVLGDDADKVLADPPISGTDSILPIMTKKELLEEGKEMHHCVYSYIPYIQRKEVFIYKMIKPERCTIELLLMDNKIISIGQVYTYCNKKVSEETKALINDWVNLELQNIN